MEIDKRKEKIQIMRLFRKYKFSDKNETLGGTISTILGVISLCLLIYGVSISFRAKGEAGVSIGSIGLSSAMLAIFGCVIGLISFKEEDKFYLLSKIGSMLCGILSVFMLSVLLMGI